MSSVIEHPAELTEQLRLPTPGCLLALDIGDARTGVALSDERQVVAMPYRVYTTAELLHDAHLLTTLVHDYELVGVVVGLPLTFAGMIGPQARHVQALADKILEGEALSLLPCYYFDERLSSSEAKRVMAAAGHSEREMRGTLDKLAAAIILQDYLDAN